MIVRKVLVGSVWADMLVNTLRRMEEKLEKKRSKSNVLCPSARANLIWSYSRSRPAYFALRFRRTDGTPRFITCEAIKKPDALVRKGHNYTSVGKNVGGGILLDLVLLCQYKILSTKQFSYKTAFGSLRFFQSSVFGWSSGASQVAQRLFAKLAGDLFFVVCRRVAEFERVGAHGDHRLKHLDLALLRGELTEGVFQLDTKGGETSIMFGMAAIFHWLHRECSYVVTREDHKQ